jgi:hypothetical protein
MRHQFRQRVRLHGRQPVSYGRVGRRVRPHLQHLPLRRLDMPCRGGVRPDRRRRPLHLQRWYRVLGLYLGLLSDAARLQKSEHGSAKLRRLRPELSVGLQLLAIRVPLRFGRGVQCGRRRQLQHDERRLRV